MTITHDRNFDDLAEKFARKVYGGLKGEIRQAVIWRDLVAAVPALEQSGSLRILDIGGGLGQFAVRLAEFGHQVTYNDLSANMCLAAKQLAAQANLAEQIDWRQGAYQQVIQEVDGQFDLILCHALMEWLAKPELLAADLSSKLAPNGTLSLTFYNAQSLVYRNLIRGNFKMLQAEFRAHPKSLTPGTPLEPETVQRWIVEAGLKIENTTGIRVFHDYVSDTRGGHQDPQSVIDMELEYSNQQPYKWLGRYIHVLATRLD